MHLHLNGKNILFVSRGVYERSACMSQNNCIIFDWLGYLFYMNWIKNHFVHICGKFYLADLEVIHFIPVGTEAID